MPRRVAGLFFAGIFRNAARFWILAQLFSFMCGVDHRQDRRHRATLALGDSRRCTMSKSEQLLRNDLDCLRLASDLTRLASYVPSSALKAHILQLARTCTSLVDRLETFDQAAAEPSPRMH